MIKCKNCDHVISDDANFCPVCGSRLEIDAKARESETAEPVSYTHLLLLFLFAASNSLYFKSYPEIVFLDLYNGESTLISDCCNRCNVLIDTGDGKNNEVTAYLKRRGVKKLDYLIITHNHNDHNGEAYNIIREIAVNNIVVSA